ncbi:hypothetical protein AKJ16_DCAP22530 [Drosera capensis]
MKKSNGGGSLVLAALLVSAIVALSFSPGNARKSLWKPEENNNDASALTVIEGKVVNERSVIEVMDYDEPGPNVNPGSGFIGASPPPPAGP